jgi:hypothetical protein
MQIARHEVLETDGPFQTIDCHKLPEKEAFGTHGDQVRNHPAKGLRVSLRDSAIDFVLFLHGAKGSNRVRHVVTIDKGGMVRAAMSG